MLTGDRILHEVLPHLTRTTYHPIVEVAVSYKSGDWRKTTNRWSKCWQGIHRFILVVRGIENAPIFGVAELAAFFSNYSMVKFTDRNKLTLAAQRSTIRRVIRPGNEDKCIFFKADEEDTFLTQTEKEGEYTLPASPPLSEDCPV